MPYPIQLVSQCSQQPVGTNSVNITSSCRVTHMKQQPILPTNFWTDLQGQNWFTSEHINMAMYLLSRQYPDIDGLSDCEYINHIGLQTTFPSPKQKFIQIINKGGCHWITLSNIFCSASEVDVYDSMPSKMSPQDIRNVCHLTKHFNNNCLTINYQSVQLQLGTTECGPFAVAFASSLARQMDPASCSYDQDSLRTEISKIFTSATFHPIENGRKKKTKAKKENVLLYCSCNLNYIAHKNDVGENMISCDNCKRWYHKACQLISDEAFRKKRYVCSSCFSTNG